jgi:hypothetical protein
MTNGNGRTAMRRIRMRRDRVGRGGTVFGPALAVVLAGVGVAWGAGPMAQPLVAQGLAEFDYENLAPRGVMVNLGWVHPGTVNPTGSIGARLDLGYLGPGVRVTTGFSQWSSTLRRSEVAVLEEQLADLVETQTGTRPEVDLGRITWSDVALNADAHVVWRVPGGLLTYAGVGGTAHVMRGGGAAVEGTFVQDLLNTIRAGANLHGGIEVPLGAQLRVVGEGRIELVQSVTYAQVRAGLQYTWGPAAPGERP